MEYFNYVIKKIKKITKTYKILFIIILIYIILFAISILNETDAEININPNDYCRITDVDYTAILHDDKDHSAKISVTEYLTFDIHAASKNNPFKEVWRELPEDTIDGLPITYNVKSVTQILDNGTEVVYKETPKMFWEDEDYKKNNVELWHYSDSSGKYPDNDESLLIYIPWTYRDQLTFKLEYEMNNAALKYLDCSELYISLYSGKTIKYLESYKAQILIPNKLMPRDNCYGAYTFGTSKSRIPFYESEKLNKGYYTFSIDLDEDDLKFNYNNRYIEFCLLAFGKDKHIFTKYAPDNDYSDSEVLDECIAENNYYSNKTKIYRNIKITMLIISIILSLIIIKKSKKKYQKEKNSNKYYKPEIEYEYFRDIPSDLDPLFAAKLVFIKDPFDENQEKNEEFSAILLSLVRKKYIKISKIDSLKDWDNKNTQIELLQSNNIDNSNIDNINSNSIENNLEPLTTSEKLFLQLIEKHIKDNTLITLDTLQEKMFSNYSQTCTFLKNLDKESNIEIGVMQEYYQNLKYNEPKLKFLKASKKSRTFSILLLLFNIISYFTPLDLAFGAYIILGISLIINAIYLKIKSNELILLTQFGENEFAKWRGLYNFLKSDTLLKERTINDLPLWEKYLIYATAFGISEKIIKAIDLISSDISDINQSIILNNHSFGRSIRFHTNSRSIHTHSHSFARSYGGHGGFGGYGGGGRGGGGGGGGH